MAEDAAEVDTDDELKPPPAPSGVAEEVDTDDELRKASSSSAGRPAWCLWGRYETARVKIIGLTLETRPDTIDTSELRRLRRYGCTRVQLGVQHTADKLLRKINRGHGAARA